MKKILFGAWHNSSAESIKPLIINSVTNNYAHDIVAFGPAADLFKKKGLDFLEFGKIENDITIEQAYKIIENTKPSIVVVGTSPPGRGLKYAPEQLLISAAKERDIPSISIIDYWHPQIRYDNVNNSDGQLAFLPTKIAALDGLSKKLLMEKGISEDRIEITGNPQHDSLGLKKQQWNERLKRTVRESIEIPKEYLNHYFVLCVGSIGDDMFRDKTGFWDVHVAESLLTGIYNSGRKDVFVRFGKHPGEAPNKNKPCPEIFASIEGLVKSYEGFVPSIATRSSGEDPDLMVLSADLIVAPRSNMLVAATMLDRDALSLQPGILDQDPIVTNMPEVNLTPRAYTREDALNLVKQAMLNTEGVFSSYRERRKVFGVDGKSTQRVFDLIKRLI